MGGALLGAALDLAARCGAHEAVLEVRASNLAAQAMYERFGFVSSANAELLQGAARNAKIMTRRLAPSRLIRFGNWANIFPTERTRITIELKLPAQPLEHTTPRI